MMNFTISGRRTEVSPKVREHIEKKIGKLQKFFRHDTETHVTLTPQKDKLIVEVTIFVDSMIFKAEEINSDPIAAIDRIVDVIDRQIRKNKTKLEKRMRDSISIVPHDDADAGEPVVEETEFKIVKSKRHSIKPMSAEEAVLQMNMLGHEFYIFKNADNDGTNIVYRRKDGDYGLIEAQL